MFENRYNVCLGEEIIAENMLIDDALLLVKAMSEKYYIELRTGNIVGIREMVRINGCALEMETVKND